MLTSLRKAKQFVIMPTDKNLGPAILERSQYIERCFQDHLLNKMTYSRLTEPESKTLCYNARAHIIRAVSQANKKLQLKNHAKTTYFSRSIEKEPL
jgi:hypothetical protein